MSKTITLEVEDLVTLVSSMVSEALKPLLVQQPKAEAPAKRSASPRTRRPKAGFVRDLTPKAAPKTKAAPKASRSAKPVSTAQHSAGRHVELVFGIDANGNLSSAQQSRARQFFDSVDCPLPKGKVTMRSIVAAVQNFNATLRGEGSTVTHWAVWNGPQGRITDHQARQLLRGSK